MTVEAEEFPIPTLILKDNEAENKLELPQTGALRWIHGRITINTTNGESSPTWNKNDVMNYIKKIGIQKNGRGFKFNLSLEMIHLLSEIHKGRSPYIKKPTKVAEATGDAIIDFEIDFAKFPLSDLDISALLQTKNLSSFDLLIQTGDKNDVASANPPTINSAKVELEVRQFIGDVDGSDINDDTAVKMTDYIDQSEIVNLQANKTEFDGKSQAVDLVAGAGILEQMLLVKDNGILSDDRITDLKYARDIRDNNFPKKSLIERSWKSLNEKNMTNYDLTSRKTGMVFVNWVEKMGRFGLITRTKSYDLLRLKTDGIAEGEDTLELYTRYV